MSTAGSGSRVELAAYGRSWLVHAIAGFLALVLSACASRPGPEVLTPVAATVPGARTVTVYVATTRERASPGRNVFTTERSARLNYAEFSISIPPGHKAGEIEWPGSTPDPATSFATIRQTVLDEETFRRRVGSRAGRRHDVGVFVHGYNTSFQEALFRLAQLSADSQLDTVPVLFAWPSEAAITGYVADREGVTYSRDYLAQVLSMLTRERSVRNVAVIGHSMGGWLTMETLRQLRLQGRGDVLARLQVVLAAPDIDLDVFRTQVAAVGRMSPPLTILVSKDDWALAASSRLSGGRERVGTLDVEDVRVQAIARQEGLRVVDISTLTAPDAFNHDRFVSFAAVYSAVAPRGGSGDPLRQAGAFVFNAAGTVLSTPFTLVGQALAGEPIR
ncbi:alpha/beta hydrolase [Microvirga makkahensis]|uniref:Alpha/beta fold hydrolase n=1 Tax=Microvirga makkahensis TaxID=1128670 RepID=A0A7X3SRK6_9HYPH|nr:alpha/beta fold hydrolase [Microvirga makkahensis]MXQ14164.1 alpha/beta fold hydrolase [Microvirga makkahensis]